MSQSHPEQHHGGSDMQFWRQQQQQQLLYKQIHELQRQQQLQQLDHGVRKQDSLNHLSPVAKPVVLNQSEMMNMSTNNAPNYMWPNNLVRPLPPMSDGKSHMMVARNLNWTQSSNSPVQNIANGLLIPNDQSQAMQSLRYTQQDQSSYGMPVPNTSDSVNQYHRLSRMSNDCDNLMTKAVENQPDKVLNQLSAFHNNNQFPPEGFLQDRTSVSTQNLQGKGFLFNNMDILNSGTTSGNFQQANRMQSSAQDQAFCGMENQALWSGNLQERVAEQVGTSHGVASLDPTEEKFLYGNDDGNWGVSFAGSLNSGSEGFLNVLPSVNDCFGGFPSLQSGSWSALMQEAVQSSTSDNGLQEEWSSLDFHKMEQSMSKTKVISGDSGEQLSAWNDNNMQAASSLTVRPLSLFNAADAGPSLSTVPSFQHSYQSTYNENNGMQNDASHMLFRISSGVDNNKQFHQGQKQNQLSESNAQLLMLDNGMWMSQTYQQQNNSADFQNSRGSSRRQQTLTTSNVAMQPDNGPNGWNSDNAVGPSAVSNSVFSADGNVWRVGSTHVNPNGRVGKPVESDIVTSRVKTNGSVMDTYGSIMTNSPKFTHESNQQVDNSQQVVFGKTFVLDTCARTKDDRNAGGNHTEPSERRPQTWESTKKNTDDGDNHQHSKKQLERVSEEGYASNNFNYIQLSSDLSGENVSPAWIDKNPFQHGSIRLPTESDQQAAGSTMLHNQTTTLGMNRGPSYSVHSSHFQAVNPISQGSKSEDHKYVRKSDFNGRNLSDVNRTHMGVEETCSIDSISVHGSASFGPSSVDCSQNKNIVQTSQDMLDLLPKVDHSRSNNTVAVPENPAQSVINAASPNSSTQGFGLRLVPPSQRQLSQTVLSYQSSISADKSRQHNAEVGDKDQCRSSYAPVMQSLNQNNASKRETLSSMCDDKPKVVSDFGKLFNSLPTSVPDIPYPGKQQQAQFTSVRPLLQHQQRDRHGHEVLHQTILARNVSLPQQESDSLDDSASDQSVLKSLPILDSGVPSSSLAPLAHISEPSSLKSDSAERENRDRMIAGFRHVHNSNPFPETNSGAQTSVSGTTQQAGFSRMLHNLWTNISAQQCLASLHPPKLTPQILQSIISNNRDTSLWAPQKATEEADKGGATPSEVGTSYSDFERQGGNQSKGASLNQPCSVKVDAAPRTSMVSPGEETWRALSDGNTNVSISSLVHMHQQDLDKGKIGQNAIPQSHISSAPNLSGDVRLSRQSLMTSDVQQQNYSLLHQIQAMKSGNSDQSRMLSGSLKGAIFPSNSQMNWNTDSRFVSPDGKVGAASQSSFPSDVKMLNSTSMDNEEINTSMSTATAEQHDLLNRIDTIGTNSSRSTVGGMEHTQISPQMASPYLKQYRSYKNDLPISANFNGQWNPNSSSLQYLFPKAPRNMDYDLMVDQTSDNNNISIPGQSSVSAAIVTKGLPSNLFPTLSDQDIVQRSMKRKRVPLELISWNKVVTHGQQIFKSIRTAELDWARAANRLCEKADYESQVMEDSLSIAQPRRRIILTSQLMQLLIPAVPARMLRVEADIAYESVTFCVAKAALTDACSMISCSEKNHDASFEDERGASKKFKTSVGDLVCSTLVENYIGRSKKIENDFLRFDRRASLLDVRLECQELEKFSTVNRLGKFHGRPHTDAVEGSAVSAMLVQRYVTAFPAPGNLPEGVTYLSL